MKEVILRKEDVNRGNLILINKKYPIRIKEDEIIRDLAIVNEKYMGHLLNKDVVKLLNRILNKLDSKEQIVPVSGFRPRKEQIDLYDTSVKENGLEFTRKFVARPDESEHQSGLAIDLGENKPDIDFICPDFPYYGIFNKFREEANKNGFIERYKKGKEEITGISQEPWHFRFVGFPHSVIIEENGYALEEYHEFIRKFDSIDNSYKFKNYCIFFVKSIGEMQSIFIEDDFEYDISGNNMDGFIITLYKYLGWFTL
jgi:D-alanyl-D-alanine dipeptidase/carboxypeptidase